MKALATLRSVIAMCVVAMTLIVTVSSAQAAPSWKSGAYMGGGNSTGLKSFSNWRNESSPVALDYLGFSSWSDITDSSWLLQQWQDFHTSGGHLVLSVPLLPSSGSNNFADGAAGDYDSYFKQLGANLMADGLGDVTLRMGWEFNGNWFPWSIRAGSSTMGPAAFIAYWRHLVRLFRAIPGSHFTFDWTVNPGPETVEADTAYPGAAYVDYVGVDVYDRGWAPDGGPISDPAARWQQISGQSYGLNWWAAWAAAHGKSITIPEWGVETQQGWNGGGDDPYFIQAMYGWMRLHHPAYETYFDYAGSALSAQNAPRAAAMYQSLWGAAGSSLSQTSGFRSTLSSAANRRGLLRTGARAASRSASAVHPASGRHASRARRASRRLTHRASHRLTHRGSRSRRRRSSAGHRASPRRG